jgi:outer membrane protein TolC
MIKQRSGIDPVRLRALTTASLILLGLAGCATPDAQQAWAPVQESLAPHLQQQVRWARTDEERLELARRTAELLKEPLSIDAAVQVALFNQRGLQAAFEDLGIAQADLIQAGRLPNPGFGLARSVHGGEVEIETGLHFNLARLLLRPLLQDIEARRLDQARQRAATSVLTLVAETRRAWILAVSAEESVRYTRQVLDAAQASAELARRMARVGNFNALRQAREQSFYAEAALQHARAEQQRRATRERLARTLGLWGEQTAFRLPERLPDLPAQPRDLPQIESMAIAQRLDLRSAREQIAQLARQVDLARVSRWVNVAELGLARETADEGPTRRTVELGFEIPIFDTGDARLARAQHVYMQAVHRSTEAAINARSEVREAYSAYRSSWEIARHQREEIVPLARRISEENLLRYNGMLIGVFELLADARSQIASVHGSIDALRDFWLAQADLDLTLVGPGRSPGLGAPTASIGNSATAAKADAH